MNDTATAAALFSPAMASLHAGGRLEIPGKRDIRSVVIDSRQADRGSLFVALPGSRVDGHDFIYQALEKGAAAVLAAEGRWSELAPELEAKFERRGASLILAGDTLSALQELGKNHLRRYTRLLRIGVTGSNGKTTTKEILASIISLHAPTIASEGNLNSETGLPLSCFRIREEHRVAVFEMGINHPGEMRVLADIFQPDIAVITNIGTAHIGLLGGSRQDIAREKREIFHHFSGTEKAFLFEGEEFYSYLGEGLQGTVVPFGPQSTKGFEGSEDLGLDGTVIHWEGLRIRFPLFGAHNVLNALASISVAAELGINKEKIAQGLERIRPLFGRSQIIRAPVTVVQDCYNANPDSVRQLFSFLSGLSWQGRKIAVLGSMRELGEHSREAHRLIGREAAVAGFQGLFFFGEEMEGAFQAAGKAGYPGELAWSADWTLLRKQVLGFVRPGDLVVLKGSRALELERLVPDLTEV